MLQTYRERIALGAGPLGTLRNPNYRKYWFGLLASVSGFQIMIIGQGWLVYEITRSPLALGYVGLAAAVPGVLLNAFGGVFADKVDRRKLLLFTQSITAALVLLLGLLTQFDVVRIWHILAIAAAAGSVQAFDQPSRQALFPQLVDRDDLMNAVALNSSAWQGTRMLAPAVGGLLIAWLGSEAAFYAGALGFLFMAFMIFKLKAPPVKRSGGRGMASEMAEGISYIKGNSLVSSLLIMTFLNSFFGLAYLQLLPIFAKDILVIGASGLGFLASTGGAGSLLGTIVAASLGRSRRKGWVLIWGSVLFGGFLVLFANSNWYTLSLAALFLAGFANSMYMISVQSTIQLTVPDELRGRVMGVYGMTWAMMPLGGMQAGAIANLMGAPFAVALGGAVVAAYGVGNAIFNRQVRSLTGVAAVLPDRKDAE